MDPLSINGYKVPLLGACRTDNVIKHIFAICIDTKRYRGGAGGLGAVPYIYLYLRHNALD